MPRRVMCIIGAFLVFWMPAASQEKAPTAEDVRVQALAERLKKNPEDDAANLEMGRHLCLVKGDWDVGLFHLAQGTDRPLRLLAQRDLARPRGVDEQVELGDAWWDLGDKEKGKAQQHLYQRAAAWYVKALPHTEGLRRNRIEKRVAQVQQAGIPVMWDHEGQPGEIRRLSGHTQAVNAVAFSPDGQHVLTAGVDLTVCLWEAATGRQRLRLQGHTQSIQSVVFLRPGQFLTGGRDEAAIVWDEATGREIRRFPPGQDGKASFHALARSGDGKRLLSGGDDARLRLWDAATGQFVREFNTVQPVHGVALSPDGRLVLSGDASSTLVLWDADSGKEIRRWQRQPAGWLNSLAFSPDGKWIVASGTEELVLWETATGKEVRRLQGHTRPVYALAFSPDGTRLASAGQSGAIRLWEVATGKEIRRFEGHTGPVYCVAFSPGGGRLVSGGADREVRLWGLPR